MDREFYCDGLGGGLWRQGAYLQLVARAVQFLSCEGCFIVIPGGVEIRRLRGFTAYSL
jgi:hypothetical protein